MQLSANLVVYDGLTLIAGIFAFAVAYDFIYPLPGGPPKDPACSTSRR